jgi:hypothetical protein
MAGLSQQRIIAFDVHPRSFGFVIFEGPREILDWGARSFRRGVNQVRVPCDLKIMRLIDQYIPDALVLERSGTKAAERMAEKMRKQASIRKVPVRVLSVKAMDLAFAGRNGNKQQIATAVSEMFPELLSILPSPRRPWESEDYLMSIFDAAAAGIAYFAEKMSGTPPPPK